ncbi:MAG: S8 family peptidase, partial [Gemmatimonadota bacterium]|nr:S8 family peptidase [Gemmatimonadota bacterium]
AVEAFERFVEHVRSLSGEVDREFRRVVGGVTFVPVVLPVEEVFRAPEFNLLRAIRPMPQVRPVPVAVTRDIAGAGAPGPPAADAKPASSEVVAIFDGGLDPASPVFRPFVEYHDLTPEPPRPEYLQHGAMVTSAFLYGPVELGTPLSKPPGAVQHYRVLPPPARPTFDDSLYWVLDRLIETLRAPGAPRIVGLSFGPDTVVEEDAEPDRWTSELDALVAELGVTFVLAAGNNGLEDDALGFNRVMVPADMVNGIGVGACTTRRRGSRLARAPYSAKGWGRPGQRIAPLGVCFGGSDDEPFVAFDHCGRLAETQGTSFAAPLAMRGLCELSAGLGEERRDPATLRGFAAHFADRPRGHRPRLRELGFGRLRESYREVWECLPNEVSVVYQDFLSRGASTTMRLPFPDGLSPDTEITLSWTLSYVSSIEPANASEYTRSGFEVVFRPHENLRSIFEVESKKQLTVLDIVRDRTLLEEMLKTGTYSFNDVPPADSGWRKLRSESAQRLSGKWETVSHGELRLAAGALLHPRLDLLYLARREGALVDAGVEPLQIALVVTIRAPEGIALYDRVHSQFPVLTPIVHHVPIRLSAA